MCIVYDIQTDMTAVFFSSDDFKTVCCASTFPDSTTHTPDVYGHAVNRPKHNNMYILMKSFYRVPLDRSCFVTLYCLRFTDIKYSWQVRVVSPRRRITVLRMELQRTRFPISTVGGTGVHRRLLHRRRIFRHGRRQIQQVNKTEMKKIKRASEPTVH